MKKIFVILLMLFLVACSPTHNAKTTINLNQDMQSGSVVTTIEYPKHEEEKHQLSDIKKKVDDFYNEYKKPFELNYKSNLEADKIVFTFSFDFKNLDEYNDKMEKLTGQKVNAEFSKSDNPFKYYEQVKGYGGQLRSFITAFEKAFDNKQYYEEKVANYLNFSYEVLFNNEKNYDTIRKEYPLKWKSFNREIFLGIENKNNHSNAFIFSLIDTLTLEKDDILMKNLESGFIKDFFTKKLGFEANLNYDVSDNDVILTFNYDNISNEDLATLNTILPLANNYTLEAIENNEYQLKFSNSCQDNIQNKTILTIPDLEFKDYNKSETNSKTNFIAKNRIEISDNSNLVLILKRPASLFSQILSFIPWILGLLVILGLGILGFRNRNNLKQFMHRQKDNLVDITNNIDCLDNSNNLVSNTNFNFNRLNLSSFITDFKDFVTNIWNWSIIGVYVGSWIISFILFTIIFSFFRHYINSAVAMFLNDSLSNGFHVLSAACTSFGSFIFKIQSLDQYYGVYTSFRFLIFVLLPLIVTCIYLHYYLKKNNRLFKLNSVIQISVLNSLILSLLQVIIFRYNVNQLGINMNLSISFLGNFFFGLIVNLIILYMFYLYENKIQHFMLDLGISILKILTIFSFVLVILFLGITLFELFLNNSLFNNLIENIVVLLSFILNIFILCLNACFGNMLFIIKNNVVQFNFVLVIMMIISIVSCILITSFVVKQLKKAYLDTKFRNKVMIGYVLITILVLYCFGNLASISMSQDTESLLFGVNLLSLACGLLLNLILIFIFDIYYDKLMVNKMANVMEKILSLKIFNFRK